MNQATRPPLRYIRATEDGIEEIDPLNLPCGSEWRIVTRYASRGKPDPHAWVQWASESSAARELARIARDNVRPLETVVYQTIFRVESI